MSQRKAVTGAARCGGREAAREDPDARLDVAEGVQRSDPGVDVCRIVTRWLIALNKYKACKTLKVLRKTKHTRNMKQASDALMSGSISAGPTSFLFLPFCCSIRKL